MASKRLAKKSLSKTTDNSELLSKLLDKVTMLENSLSEKDAKLKAIETHQKNSDIGTSRYGLSDWKEYRSGNEVGLKRDIYVDLNTMNLRR